MTHAIHLGCITKIIFIDTTGNERKDAVCLEDDTRRNDITTISLIDIIDYFTILLGYF
jgi:hypothetical protein